MFLILHRENVKVIKTTDINMKQFINKIKVGTKGMIPLFLFGKRSRIVRIEISADCGRDNDVEQAVVKPGQKSVAVAAGLDQGADLFKTADDKAMVLLAVRGGY